MKINGLTGIWAKYRQIMLKMVWIKFCADTVGVICMGMSQMIYVINDFGGLYSEERLIFYQTYKVVIVFAQILWTLIVIVGSSMFVYNRSIAYSFKNLDTSIGIKKKLALILAILTAPFIFLVSLIFNY